MITIAAEQFTLTPAIRTHVETNLSKITNLLPESVGIHVFLSEPSQKTFKVLLTLHVWGKDLIVHEEGADLYKAVDTARVHLARQIIENKHRWVKARRKPARETIPHETI
jgi:ribosomal subunit interface protein